MHSTHRRGADQHRKKYWRHHDRSTYRCADCGRLESHPDVRWIEVHHIDENPTNGAMSNLVGLCRHCHHIRHGNDPPEALDDWKARIHRLGGTA